MGSQGIIYIPDLVQKEKKERVTDNQDRSTMRPGHLIASLQFQWPYGHTGGLRSHLYP